MAAPLPAKLNIPAIAPFARRAAQLEKYKPIAAYWCNYYVVKQILGKGLQADEECMNYTMTLMDKLEQAKVEAPGNDAIVDDIAAKAYMEQFAVETFQRADDAIHTNKASKQTVDTFQAATTFLELLTTWGPLDPEVVAKIKYAKYHAVRIVKAIKAGEDPNASNPVDEDLPAAGMDGIEQGEGSASAGSAYQQPTVESVPDSMLPSRSASVPQASAIAPPPLQTQSDLPATAQDEPFVSPIEPSETDNRQGSVGGGYFPTTRPSIPTVRADLPPVDAMDQGKDSLITPVIDAKDDMPTPSDYYSQRPSAPPVHTSALPRAAPSAPPVQPASTISNGPLRTDDDSILLAQKHAKWATSALNFEDVETAVKELRLALQSLGAS